MNTFAGIWIFVAAVAQIGVNAEVNVTVFYESLCPDSIRFIKKQLYPTYKVLRDYMNVELVPFGKAYIATKPWSITCQHGRDECLGNAVQACALSRYPDTEMQVEIVYCHMSDYDPPTAGQRCARKLNYNGDGIEECSVNEEGRRLLAQHGERTQRFRERLSFVPTILFNDDTECHPSLHIKSTDNGLQEPQNRMKRLNNRAQLPELNSVDQVHENMLYSAIKCQKSLECCKSKGTSLRRILPE